MEQFKISKKSAQKLTTYFTFMIPSPKIQKMFKYICHKIDKINTTNRSFKIFKYIYIL